MNQPPIKKSRKDPLKQLFDCKKGLKIIRKAMLSVFPMEVIHLIFKLGGHLRLCIYCNQLNPLRVAREGPFITHQMLRNGLYPIRAYTRKDLTQKLNITNVCEYCEIAHFAGGRRQEFFRNEKSSIPRDSDVFYRICKKQFYYELEKRQEYRMECERRENARNKRKKIEDDSNSDISDVEFEFITGL